MPIFARGLRAALLATSAGLAVPALAQEQEIHSLPSVSVSTAAGPGSIATQPLTNEQLSRAILDLRQSMSSDTADLLTRLPGVSANTGGGFSSMPAIRGLTEQRLKILVDGHPIDAACPNDMNSPLSYTDPQTIARIDVITGVSPVSMGGDSIGGVINVESARPQFAGRGETLLTGNASTFYRSNGDGFGGAVTLTA
ncbi:MAG: TonB-dependent receptor plug domain-containing protein, partial [Sphingomonadales bacterium]|nr:TonB-dependent receptor plug domain-containing protein [Sphingomonadales bacterium]